MVISLSEFGFKFGARGILRGALSRLSLWGFKGCLGALNGEFGVPGMGGFPLATLGEVIVAGLVLDV